MRYMKQILAAAAATATAVLCGCGAFNEYVPADPNFAGYGVAPQSRAEAERQAFWNNYRTPVGSTAPAGSGTRASGPATNAAGQCTTGVMTTCVFPGGTTGPCCAPAQ